MNLREAAQQALEALESADWYINQLEQIVYSDDDTDTHEERAKVQAAVTALRAALSKDRSDDIGKTYDTDDTPEQKMLRKKWFGGRLYGHFPFLEAVDATMESLYDKLDEAQGTWRMLDNHIADANKMVATSQEFRQVEPVAWLVTTEMQDGTRKTYPLTGRFKDVKAACDFGEPVPLYAAPPPRKPLTDDEIAALLSQSAGVDLKLNGGDLLFARALERSLWNRG